MNPIIVAIGAAQGLINAINTVQGWIGAGSRAIVLVVNNHTDNVLSRTGFTFDHGGFKVPAPDQIPAQSSAVFGTTSIGVMTGVQGTITWGWTDVKGYTWFDMSFDDPFIGSNSGGAEAWMMTQIPLPPPIGEITIPGPSDRYSALATIGSGNVAQMDYDLRAG